MPQTEIILEKTLKRLTCLVGPPQQAQSIEKITESVRQIIKNIPHRKKTYHPLLVGICVWLYKRMTGNNPTVMTIISILSHPETGLSQTDVNDAISGLTHEKLKNHRGTLVKSPDGDQISLNYSLEKAIADYEKVK